MSGVQKDSNDRGVALLCDAREAVAGGAGISGLDAAARFVHVLGSRLRLIQRDVPRQLIIDTLVNVIVRIAPVSLRVFVQRFFIALRYSVDFITPKAPVGIGHDPFFVLVGLRDRVLARADDLAESLALHAFLHHQRKIIRCGDIVDFFRIQTVWIVVFRVLCTDGFCLCIHHVAEGAHLAIAALLAGAEVPQILGTVIRRPQHHAVGDISDLQGLAVGKLHGAAFACCGFIHRYCLIEVEGVQAHEQVQDLRHAGRIPFLVRIFFIKHVAVCRVHHADGCGCGIRRLPCSFVDGFSCKRRHCPHKSQCRRDYYSR